MTIDVEHRRPLAKECAPPNADPNAANTVKICRRIVAALTEREREHAARSSYRYFAASTSRDPDCRPSDAVRDEAAAAMARRHLAARKGDEDAALESVRRTVRYRIDSGVDDIRRAYREGDATDADAEAAKRFADMRAGLDGILKTGLMYVRGYDKKGRPVFVMDASAAVEWDADWYVPAHVYMMERTLAALERSTDEESIISVVDYRRYSSKNAPPLKLAKVLVKTMADHWPERLERTYLLDAPLAFRVFWAIIKPFIDPDTKSKVVFLTGDNQKRSVLGKIISEEEACPFMFPEGKKTSNVDMHKFLHDIPFDRTCDNC